MGSVSETSESSKKQYNLEELRWDESPVGTLEVEVDEFYLEQLENKVEHKEDIMVIIRFSNQV